MELQRRLFTADEYHRMAEAGVLGDDDRVELLDGEIVEMTPIGSHHAACVDRLNVLLQQSLAGRGIVRVQGPIRPDRYSEPQPDLTVLKARDDFYASAHPEREDVLLVVEVSDSSLRFDRQIKIPIYARAAIREVWLVDLAQGEVEVFTHPTSFGYRQSWRVRRGEHLTMSAFPEVALLVDDLTFTR